MVNKLTLLILLLILPGLVSAAGLRIVNQSSNNINKIFERNEVFTFDIINDEAFNFYNISLYNFTNIDSSVISVLTPGQVYRVNNTISKDISYNSSIRIKGFYTAQVGASNSTHNINIDFYSGVSKCNFVAIKGDKVKWTNTVNDDIILRNSVTQNDVVTIIKNGTYETTFDAPTTFQYYFLRRGYIFTNPCTITVLDDNGLVNNPEYDAFLYLNVSIIYTPTNISYNILLKNYTVNVFQSQDGVMSITNNGNVTAKNILLSGEWFGFSSNGFDLAPGATKALTYTISPIVANTNDTNKIYSKNLMINGNFPQITENFTIYVPYMNLDTMNGSSNFQNIFDMFKIYCASHPQESFCRTEPSVVYVYGNDSGKFNVTFGQEQVKGIFDYIFTIGDKVDAQANYDKEKLNSLETQMNQTTSYVSNVDSKLTALEKANEERASFTIFLTILVGLLIVSSLVAIIIISYKKYNKRRHVERW